MLKRLAFAFVFLFASAAMGAARRKAVNPDAFSAGSGAWYTPTGVELKVDGALRMTLGQLSRASKLQPVTSQAAALSGDGPGRYPAVVEKREDGGFLLPVFVKAVNIEAARKAIEASGGTTSTVSAGIIVARIPAENLLTVADAPSVQFIGASHRKKKLMDYSRPEMKVDSVQNGSGLPQAYTGRGVVVGVVDTGIDVAHKDFQDPDGKTRILYLWDQSDATGPAPSGFSKGREYTKAQIDAGSCQEKDTDGHGTHVTGSAAGNGNTRPGSPYRGVAPEADIVFVKTDFSEAGIVDGCNYIFQKAAALGKPAVCNLSLGGHDDPHDGTSSEDSMLDGLQGVGKVVVAAGGNEGGDAIHLGYDMMGTNYDTGYSSYLTPVAQTVNVYAVIRGSAKFGFYGYGTSSNPFDGFTDLSLGTSGSKNLMSGSTSVCQIQYDATATLSDGSRVLTFVVTFTQDPTKKYSIEFYTYGTGHLDAWVSDAEQATWDTETGTGIWPGDTKMTVGSPATGKKTIAVAAYISKTSWLDSTGKTQNNKSDCDDSSISSIACFSSLGPTRDGRTKPDIAAPGMFILSALSKDSTKDATDVVQGGSYFAEQGTSMASPHMAGLVALMLQAKPSLTTDDVKNILSQKARSDSRTGTVPNNTWGSGKADGFESVKAVAGTATVRTLTVTKAGTGSGTVSSSPAGVNCGSTCTATFANGQTVTLTQTADTGATFAGWGGACSGSTTCQITMDGDKSVSATFSGSQSVPELLLSSGRIRASVEWRSQYNGQSGQAYALPQKDGFGYFYFTDANNPEVFVKCLDFGSGKAILLVGGITDFYYKVTFRNSRNQTLVFEKPAGSLSGFADASSLGF